MAFNPMQLVKLKDRIHLFKEDHPKFIPFVKMLRDKAAMEGTILEVKAILPDGKTYTSNIRLTPNDIETLQMFLKDKKEDKDSASK